MRRSHTYIAVDGATSEILMRGGRIVTIDTEDLDRVINYSWSACGGLNTKYAHSNIEGKTVSLHRMILNAPSGSAVDHINRNGLDCRKSNLRLLSHRENAYNSQMNKRNTTGFRGVRVHRSKFQALIKYGGKQRILGSFDTPEEAARAYDAAASQNHGLFNQLNFPLERG